MFDSYSKLHTENAGLNSSSVSRILSAPLIKTLFFFLRLEFYVCQSFSFLKLNVVT